MKPIPTSDSDIVTYSDLNTEGNTDISISPNLPSSSTVYQALKKYLVDDNTNIIDCPNTQINQDYTWDTTQTSYTLNVPPVHIVCNDEHTVEDILEMTGYKHFKIKNSEVAVDNSDISYTVGDYVEAIRFNKNGSPICVAGEIHQINEDEIIILDIEYDILYKIKVDSYIK